MMTKKKTKHHLLSLSLCPPPTHKLTCAPLIHIMKHKNPTDLTVPVARAINAACLSAVDGPPDRGERPAERDVVAVDVEGASWEVGRGEGRGVGFGIPLDRTVARPPYRAQQHTPRLPLSRATPTQQLTKSRPE